MFIERCTQYLQAGGYQQVVTDIPQLNVYYRGEQNRVYCVCIIDDREGFLQSQEQSHGYINRTINLFKKNETLIVECMAVVVSSDIQRTRQNMWEMDCFWLIEAEQERLIIYENQPSEFDILKDCVECSFSSIYGVRKPAFIKENRKKNLCKLVTVNSGLILVNIIIFVIMEFFGDTTSSLFMLRHGGMYVAWMFRIQEAYRFFTAAFLHMGAHHLVNNMVVLAVTGPYVEQAMGRWRYLIMYLVVCVGANIISAAIYFGLGQWNVVSCGASGAVFGVIGALLYIVILNKGRYEGLAARRLMFMIALSLYHGFISVETNHSAHVAGVVLGFIMAMMLYRKNSIHQNKKTE